MELRDDGVDSLIESALEMKMTSTQIQTLLASYGWARTIETVRKRISEVKMSISN